MMVLGWVLFGPRPRIGWPAVGLALLWPVCWLVYTLLHRAVTGWCPYPFMDVTLGYGRVLGNRVVVVLVLVVVTALFWLGDRYLPSTGRAPRGGGMSNTAEVKPLGRG